MNHIEIDAAVCAGLGKRPGESLHEAALRMVRWVGGTTQQRVAAHCILNDTLTPWENMRRAAMWLRLRSPDVAQRSGGR